LVTRESIAGDRRTKCVVLTDTGRAAKTRLRRVATECLEEALAGVTQEDYDAFIRCLQHIVGRPNPTHERKEVA
jgi:DNA-binding MarR family transcriptional regulator